MDHKQYENLIISITKARNEYQTKFRPFILFQEGEFITIFLLLIIFPIFIFYGFMEINIFLGRSIFNKEFYIEGTIISISLLILYLCRMIYTNYILSFFQKLIDTNAVLYKTINNNDSNELIIEKINKIKNNIVRFEKIRESLTIRKYNTFDEHINTSILLEKKWLVEVIQDLISDLSINIKNIQNSLISAKSEVEKMEQTPLPPLSGGLDKGLKQVSELQRARLDRQIEQFEELQRVLMKV